MASLCFRCGRAVPCVAGRGGVGMGRMSCPEDLTLSVWGALYCGRCFESCVDGRLMVVALLLRVGSSCVAGLDSVSDMGYCADRDDDAPKGVIELRGDTCVVGIEESRSLACRSAIVRSFSLIRARRKTASASA